MLFRRGVLNETKKGYYVVKQNTDSKLNDAENKTSITDIHAFDQGGIKQPFKNVHGLSKQFYITFSGQKSMEVMHYSDDAIFQRKKVFYYFHCSRSQLPDVERECGGVCGVGKAFFDAHLPLFVVLEIMLSFAIFFTSCPIERMKRSLIILN